MKRAAVYSRSGRSRIAAQSEVPPVPPITWREWRKRHARGLRIAGFAALALLVAISLWAVAPAPGITQQDLEAAVERALEAKKPAPSAADAYESILPSVVHVRGLPDAPDADVQSTAEAQSGTGVVIVDSGIILTNLHVVHGAKRIQVVFANGLEADATVIGVQPEHDLAVLQAKTIPDDLVAATMRSTAGLRPGEQVVAVGVFFWLWPP